MTQQSDEIVLRMARAIESGTGDPDSFHGEISGTALRDARVAYAVAYEVMARSDGEVTEAAARLVAKLDECAPHIANAASFMHAHGMIYNGPQYGEALEALRSTLQHKGTAP